LQPAQAVIHEIRRAAVFTPIGPRLHFVNGAKVLDASLFVGLNNRSN
jgi:hypothetical protein